MIFILDENKTYFTKFSSKNELWSYDLPLFF